MEKTSRRIWVVPVVMLFALLPAVVMAQADNQVGLVVVHGDDVVVTQCISIDGEISGLQILELSSLDARYDAAGFGAAVCRIDNEGCNFPEESCFCQCEDLPCRFWSYWYWDEEISDWVYSPVGAGIRTVSNGDVEAWVWTTGSSLQAPEVDSRPPSIAFEDICVVPAPTAAVTPTPTATPLPPVIVVPVTVIPITPPVVPTGWQPESPLQQRTPTATSMPTTIAPSPPPSSEPVMIPEPFTLLLYASGLAGISLRAWRSRRRGE